MTASMLHGDADVVGSVTSGGTESILCAIKAYRDRARDLYPHITHPEMVRYAFDTQLKLLITSPLAHTIWTLIFKF